MRWLQKCALSRRCWRNYRNWNQHEEICQGEEYRYPALRRGLHSSFITQINCEQRRLEKFSPINLYVSQSVGLIVAVDGGWSHYLLPLLPGVQVQIRSALPCHAGLGDLRITRELQVILTCWLFHNLFIFAGLTCILFIFSCFNNNFSWSAPATFPSSLSYWKVPVTHFCGVLWSWFLFLGSPGEY